MQFSFKLGKIDFNYGRSATVGETRGIAPDEMPETYVGIDGPSSYTFQRARGLEQHFEELIMGMNGTQNLLVLAESIPEIFAPIREIAVRVADAVWQLKRASTDNPIYTDKDFNRLFTDPNPTQSMKELLEEAVFYELLTGKQFFVQNAPRALDGLGDYHQNVGSWFNLPAHEVNPKYRDQFNLYTSTELSDIIQYFECNGRKFDTDRVCAVQGMNLRNKREPLDGKPALRSAKRAISNLIAVYEARGIIYIKRGMLGLIVSKQEDSNGTVAMKPKEKKQIRDEFNQDFGLTGNRDLVGISNVAVDYINMAMSIKDLMPFDETLLDAMAIYATLLVPRHLVPSKDNSTFANADADLKKFYTSVVIPLANKYAEKFTKYFRFDKVGKFVAVSYEHVELLQADKKLEAEVFKTNVDSYTKLWDGNHITRNEFLVGIGREEIGEEGDVYKKEVEVDPITGIDPITGKSTKPEPAKV